MVTTGKANGIETMRFIVSTNFVHISVLYAIHNNAKALKGRHNTAQGVSPVYWHIARQDVSAPQSRQARSTQCDEGWNKEISPTPKNIAFLTLLDGVFQKLFVTLHTIHLIIITAGTSVHSCKPETAQTERKSKTKQTTRQEKDIDKQKRTGGLSQRRHIIRQMKIQRGTASHH